MRFALSEDALSFAAATRDVLGDVAPPAHVRTWWRQGESSTSTPSFTDDAPWTALVDMGVVAACVPPDQGGSGLELVEVIGVCEEVGAAALPEPVVATAVVGAPLLAALRETQAVAAGRPTGSALLERALDEAVVGTAPVALATAGDSFVECADSGWLLVEEANEVHLLDGRRPTMWGQSLVPQRSVDGARRVCRIDRAQLDLSAATLVAEGAVGAGLVSAARRRAAVATAAQLVGLGRTMLQLTVDYVSERRQFGAPVGSFQAVKHRLADAALHLEFAVPPVRFAAAVLSGSDGADDPEWGLIGSPEVATATAKAMASDAAERVAAAALQCHGAIGYTVEHDLHLFMKRTWALARCHGTAATHRRAVADGLLR